MSFHRENVIWQSADGTWSRGFFESYATGDEDDGDYDPEWDVEYDYSSFNWASTGHRSAEDAARSWDGANPGGYSSYPHGPDTAEQCLDFDVLAADLEAVEKERAERVRREHPGHYRYGEPYSTYSGPSKLTDPAVRKRMLRRAAQNFVTASVNQGAHWLQGYANDETKAIAAAKESYSALREQMLADGALSGAQARDADVAMLSDLHERLTKLIDDTTAQRQRDFRYGRPAPRPLEPVRDLRDKTAEALEKARRSRPRAAARNAGGGQGRKAAGTPVGGQFDSVRRGRSGVSL